MHSTWASRTDTSGKRELEAWLRRFAQVGLQIYPDEVIARGPLWRQTICVRGHTNLDDPEKGRVYYNRYVIWGRSRWGKVYEDTEASSGLDQYLASRGPDRDDALLGHRCRRARRRGAAQTMAAVGACLLETQPDQEVVEQAAHWAH